MNDWRVVVSTLSTSRICRGIRWRIRVALSANITRHIEYWSIISSSMFWSLKKRYLIVADQGSQRLFTIVSQTHSSSRKLTLWRTLNHIIQTPLSLRITSKKRRLKVSDFNYRNLFQIWKSTVRINCLSKLQRSSVITRKGVVACLTAPKYHQSKT